MGYADLHMHTTASDGIATVAQVLDHVAALGRLNVIAITDHDTLDASLWAYEHRAQYPFDIVPGVEVSSAEGHVLALWVQQPIPKRLSLAETAAAIHEQDGVAILAHPFEWMVDASVVWRYVRQPEVLLSTGIDGIEAHNAASPTPGTNRLAARLARRLNLPVTGGSDAHTLGGIGTGLTSFSGVTAVELRTALARGETRAEGTIWPITDYLRLLPATTRRKLSAFSAMNTR